MRGFLSYILKVYRGVELNEERKFWREGTGKEARCPGHTNSN